MTDIALYEIALRGTPERFPVALPDGTALGMTVSWRNRGGAGWMLDIDTREGVRLVSGIPLVTGCNLLQQFQHLGIPGALVMASDGPDPGAAPEFTTLGVSARLYYMVPA